MIDLPDAQNFISASPLSPRHYPPSRLALLSIQSESSPDADQSLRIYLLNVELLSLENQFDCGAINSDRNMLPDCVEGIRDLVTHFLLMRFSSRLMASNIISGEQWTKMERLSMCFFRVDEMPRQPNDSSADC